MMKSKNPFKRAFEKVFNRKSTLEEGKEIDASVASTETLTDAHSVKKLDRVESTLEDRSEVEKDEPLWERAYRHIDAELREKYEALLSEEGKQKGENAQSVPRREQLNVIIESSLQQMDSKDKGGLKDGIAKVTECTQAVKGFVDTAVKASPEACLVWAGVCVVLSLLTNPKTASEANKAGLNYVTSRLCYYLELEHLFWSSDSRKEHLVVLERKFLDNWVELYQRMLEFQLQSIIRLRDHRHLAKDIFLLQDWQGMVTNIKEQEAIMDKDMKQIRAALSGESLHEIEKNSAGILEAVNKLQQSTEENTNISKKNLEVQQDIRDELTDHGKKCLQLFRLASEDRDDTYEWYKNKVENRLEGTCNWFLSQAHYTNWLKQDSGLLMVSADPGCGKSVLAKHLVDSRFDAEQPSATICYFFFKDQIQSTQRQALCALLHQMLSHKPSLIKHALPGYKENGTKLINLLNELWNVFAKVATDPTMGPIIFVLDAIDECKPSERRGLISELKDRLLGQMGDNQVKLFLTTRPYKNVMSNFQDLISQYPEIRISGENHSEDIAKEVNIVIRHRVQELRRTEGLDEKKTAHLEKQLLNQPQRTYLWVHLVFENWLEEGLDDDTNGIDKIIANPPLTVYQAYEEILSKSKNKPLARMVFCIMIASYRPLNLRELNIAVHLRSSGVLCDLDSDEQFEIALRNWCGLLVSINDKKVYFLHQTAREYLVRIGLSGCQPRPDGPISETEAHSALALSCINYLDLPDYVEDDSRTISSQENLVDGWSERVSGFAEYASVNWMTHFHDASLDKNEDLMARIETICDPQKEIVNRWISIYSRQTKWAKEGFSTEGLDTLWIASFVGATELVKKILHEGHANHDGITDEYRCNALIIAAGKGHDLIVGLLVDADQINVNSRDNEGRTALYWSTTYDHQSIVERLLAVDTIDVNIATKEGNTPLMMAARDGHSTIVQLLLKNPNIEAEMCDEDGTTALHWAAMFNHADVAQMLISLPVEVNVPDHDGRTPLLWAAQEGHESVVSLLLTNENVIHEAKSVDGDTAIGLAALNGHASIVNMLLAVPVNADTQDIDGYTPLIAATMKGHVSIVQLLLEKGKVNVNARSRDGSTALNYAAFFGHELIAETILTFGLPLDADIPDYYGVTPLMEASRKGYEGIVKLLLEKGKVYPSWEDHKSMTALSYAFEEGHEEIVKLLRGFGPVDK
ncbi:hypothetical protein AWENTII_002788 [Aspergillus wentii]|nr:hypothetical protein MW887_007659 [Aspergillus wentii]